MERSEAAAYLAGAKQVEGAEASAPTNLHVISGEVVEKSENGKVKVDLGGLVYNGDDDQHIEIDTLGGLEVGDTATILLSGQEHRGMTPLGVGGVGTVDRIVERVSSIEADYIKAAVLEVERGRIDTLETTSLTADSAVIQELQVGKEFVDDLAANNITVNRLVANSAYINNLELQGITANKISATTGYIDDLTTNNITASDISSDHAAIGQLDSNYAHITNGVIDNAKIGHADVNGLSANYATVGNLTAATGRISNLEATRVTTADLEANYITADTIESNYVKTDMSNTDVAWIQNGTIKDGAITNAMINSLSANKLTAGTINGETINVTNINASNITTGTINGQRIGEGSLSLSKLEEDVYTEQEVDNKLATMQAEIDGAIETWTGTAVPTLQNAPAVNWNTNAIKDTHVGDVYFVVNSQSQQNGYNYRFTKSGNTYSWQLIKDSDVTNALSRLSTAEGKITTFDSDISTLKTDTGTLKTKTESLETRMSDAEDDILDKVDTTTFNEVSDTVDQHSQTITQMSQTLSNKADGSTVTALTTRVSKTEQDINGITETLSELSDTVETKADGSTVQTISNNLNTVSNTVNGHTQQLSSITSTQTTIQGNAVKSTVQLWFTKANTTAPAKPTAHVTTNNASTANAWNLAVPTYNSSYPNYYYCYEYQFLDGTYGWSAVTRDIATGEAQSTARTAASDASNAVSTANTANTNASNAVSTANTANTNASNAVSTANTANTNASNAVSTANTANTNASNAVSTANTASTTANTAKATADKNLKESQQLWFTKANSTAPSKPTSKVTSTATTGNAWTTRVPTYNDSYKYYFYCMQYVAADGTVTWSDVIYDQATTEAQSVARTASANLSTLQSDYATFKQTTTEFESTVGTTYATKTELQTTDGNVSSLTTRVSTAETNIQQNASDILLRATKTEASQMAQPNLSPWFSLVPIENDNVHWKILNSNTTFTALDDGWAHLHNDNSSGTAVKRTDYLIMGSPSVKPGEDYTWLLEYRNNSSTGANQNYIVQDSTRAVQFWGNSVVKVIEGKSGGATTTLGPSQDFPPGTEGVYVKRVVKKAEDADSTHLNRTGTLYLAALVCYANAGSIADYDIRVSLYEGEYTGPYKPYVGSQLYASQAELKVANDAIDLKVSKNDVINQINVSTEGITIDADRVNITGATIFTTGRLSESSLNSTYDANGAAATVQTNLNNLQIGGRNLCAEAQWEVGYLQTGTTAALHAEDAHKERTSALISVAPGDLLTFQAWVLDTTGWETWQPWLGYRFYSDASTPIGSREAKYNTTGTNYVSWAGITVPEGAAFVRFSWRHYGGSRSKLELGNKATDWTPAPEDVTADALASGIEYIEGTQTAATNLWTGVTKETALVAGKSIAYKLPYAGTSTAATLNLTLAGGGTTGAKAVKMVYSTSNNTGALSNVTTHWPVNSIIQMTYDGTQWVISNYNTNVDDKNARNVRFYNIIVAGEALKAASIIGMHADGKFYQVKENATFLLSAPLLWLTTAKAADATNADAIYTHAYDVNLGTYYTSFANTTKNCTVYLVGTVSGNTFSTYGSSSAQYLTVTEPTTEDGRFYIPLGRLSNASTGKNYFNYVVDYPVSLYAYLDGEFRQVTPTEIVATQTIYIQAASGTGSVSGTTTWVESAAESASSDDSSVTPIWTTKRPTYRTQFPVTFVATQHKRLDGTVTCTTPCKDDTTTVIDGGHITTGTIDASVASITNINASNITSGQISADYINTTGLLISTSQVDGLTSKMEGYDDTLQNMADEAALRGKWVKVDENGVEVGNGGNATRVDADSVDFLVGGTQVATAGADGFAATHMSTPAIDIGDDWSITVSGGIFSINYIGS